MIFVIDLKPNGCGEMRKRKKAGFSLVELLIAIMLFIMVAAPLMIAFPQAIKMERRSSIHALATYEAQLKMEEAYGMTSADLRNYPLTIAGAPGSPVDLTYRCTVDDYNLPGVSVSNLYKVVITVVDVSYAVSADLEAILYAE